ncbi:hypothetical protein [Arsenicicoccus dermatophilus]|uniref:hypothetical protein n=1 Tax=Arsenicicoccus dermatophilus TaxID=1076331 RepID=UPI0039173CC8
MVPTKRTLPATLAVVVAASGLLSGCLEREESRAAAVVDGRTILESDVQQATREFNTGSSKATQPMSPTDVVTALAYGQFVLPAVQQAGQAVSDDVARQVLDKIDDPSPTTVEFVRSALALGKLDPAVEAKVVQQLKAADIRVNPRYGTFDRERLSVRPEGRNWMTLDAAAATRNP